MWSDLAVTRMVSDLDDYEEEVEEEEEGRDYSGGNGSSLSLRINRAPVIDMIAPQEAEKRKDSRKEEKDILIDTISWSSNTNEYESSKVLPKTQSNSVNNEGAGQPMDIAPSSAFSLLPVTEHPIPTAEGKADTTNQSASDSSPVIVSGDSTVVDVSKEEKEVGGWTVCPPDDSHHQSIGSLTAQSLSSPSDSSAMLLPLPPLYTGGSTIGTKRFSSMMLKSTQQRPKIGRLHGTGCSALFGPEY